MDKNHPKWPTVERLAREKLHTEHETVRKWRQRGVPAKQAMRLILASDGMLCLGDFVAEEQSAA